MLVKCHEHLHPLVRLDRNYVDQDILKQDCNLDIFEQIAGTIELAKELVKRELLVFKRY
jgi:hypothetical protein